MGINLSSYRALDRRVARNREHIQAQARPARARFLVNSRGIGEARLRGDSALFFDTFFLDEPTFSYGVTAVASIPSGSLPLATATVLEYKTNNLGFFTGVEVGFRVQSESENLSLKFSLTFEGHALRTTALGV